MPDEPSGALAVLVLAAFGSVILLGALVLAYRWLT